MVEYWHDAYRRANQLRHDFGPVAKPTGNDIFTLFSDNVYSGGSLTLYALRQVVGERTFSEIERGWVARYKDESVSTDQFIAFASRVAHRDLTGFLRDWLYGTTVPPMPGHPDWTADPVAAAPLRPARWGASRWGPRRCSNEGESGPPRRRRGGPALEWVTLAPSKDHLASARRVRPWPAWSSVICARSPPWPTTAR